MEVIEDEVEERGTGSSWTIVLASFVDLLLSNLGFSNLRKYNKMNYDAQYVMVMPDFRVMYQTTPSILFQQQFSW